MTAPTDHDIWEIRRELESRPGPGFGLLVIFWLFALSLIVGRVLQEIGAFPVGGGVREFWTWLWLT